MKNMLYYVIMLVTLALLTVAPSVHASSPNYDITKVEIDDVEVSGTYDVERDTEIEIEVTLQGDANMTADFVDDVRIEAEIIGYEFGPISDTTPVFSVDKGITYKKILHLHIPEDIDASEVYTLRIRASDKNDDEEVTISLNIDEQRHFLNIFDIVVSPTKIMAGKPFFTKVRVENLGEKEENDIKVMVSVPELGISESGFIPELVTQIDEQEEEFFEQQSSDQIEFILRVPEDASTGVYTVQVDVIYNRGNSKITETKTISVDALPQAANVETIINPESTSKTTMVGSEVVYRIMVANLGTEKGVYSIQLDGTQWADAHVEPGFLTVLPDSTGEFRVFITPMKGVDARTYTFNARVLQGNEVVSDVILQTKVEEAEQSNAPAFKTILAVIFAVLVVVLIVLGIVVAIRKSAEDEETPNAAEGQTYYYSPNR